LEKNRRRKSKNAEKWADNFEKQQNGQKIENKKTKNGEIRTKTRWKKSKKKIYNFTY
jgi:hypothetical protein